MLKHRAFFDRSPGSIAGVFTIEDSNGVKVFNRIPARSGQWGYTNTSWTRAKSPIPFGGNYKIWLREVLQRGQNAGYSGIGEFRRISNTDNHRLIQSPDGKFQRWDIGFHPDNSLPGSVGCIVIPSVTSFWQISKWMDEYAKLYEYLELNVV